MVRLGFLPAEPSAETADLHDNVVDREAEDFRNHRLRLRGMLRGAEGGDHPPFPGNTEARLGLEVPVLLRSRAELTPYQMRSGSKSRLRVPPAHRPLGPEEAVPPDRSFDIENRL